jgi:4'-phosphopantetheinyl transferase
VSAPVVRFAPVAEAWLAAAESPEVPAWAADRLTPLEHGRYGRHRTVAGRAAYGHAHLLARDCLAELAGEPVELAQRCAGCGGEDHGAPYVIGRPDLFVSLSHSHGWVAAMAATQPCGIDVQVVGRVPDRALTDRERVLAPDDLARSRLWARKEAVIKSGAATLDDLGSLDVADPDPRLHDWSGPEGALAAAVSVVGAWITLG